LQGPVKMVEVMVNTPSDGTSSVEKSDEHAAFHAARNARNPLPDAPNARTSNTLPQEPFCLATGADTGGTTAGGFTGGAGDGIGGLAGASLGGFAEVHGVVLVGKGGSDGAGGAFLGE
jgi:hypothetical protein